MTPYLGGQLDLVGYTALAATLPPMEAAAILHALFSDFDAAVPPPPEPLHPQSQTIAWPVFAAAPLERAA